MQRERTDWVSVSAVTRGAIRLLVCARDPDTTHRGCRLSLREAVRAVAQPLFVLVEHQVNDAAFLRRVMPPVWRNQLDDWERLGELRYENGGGITVMSALVDFHCQDENARLAFGLPADVWRLVHFIVFDHDGVRLDSPSANSRKLERSCHDAGMSDRSYRLERRDQEHYLPVEAMRQIVEERVTDCADRDRVMTEIVAYAGQGDDRHFAPLTYFKNEFRARPDWPDNWFERDGAWPEMTRLAERLASAM